MKKLVFTIGLNGYDVGFRRCIDSQREYAKRIGADFILISKPTVDDPALAAWLKVTFIKRALESGYRYVAYIDADCRIAATAPDFTLEFAGTESKICMGLGRTGRINSGVIFADYSDKAIQFLDQVIDSITQNIPPRDRANLRFENGNIIYVEAKFGGVKELSQLWNNSWDSNLTDYIRHFTGPLKGQHDSTLSDRMKFRFKKLISPRPKKAPESRSAEFAERLLLLTDLVAEKSLPRQA
ncbi:hypothetical protein ACTXPA_13475 [Glutamicibacter arilaitensis]|uniref:hypothetical protein n=1 Tax=Glutamicibacter arilaitensis TaxID=256701 RepID=UPI003FCFC34B